MDIKQLAKRKLKEFHRWARISNLFHEPTESFDKWLIPSFEFDSEDYKLSKYHWQREAPNEVNEILSAINAIQKPRLRAIVIMSYIATDKLIAKEQSQRLGIAESTYYLAKNEALREFASRYRNGVLEEEQDAQFMV